MQAANSNDDAHALALRALVWTLIEPTRALRLIETTGMNPRDLRDRIGDPAVLAATLAFLAAHEPDLIACAATLGLPPGELIMAHRQLESGQREGGAA